MNKKLRSLIVILTLSLITGCTNNPINENKKNEPSNIEENEEKNTVQDSQSDFSEKEEDEELKLKNKLLDIRDEYINRMNEAWQKYSNIHDEWGRGNLPNADLREAVINTYKEYDNILNEIYQDLKKYLEEDEMQKITDEQLEWIEYKEKSRNELQEVVSYMELDKNELNITKTRCYELLNYLIIAKKEEAQSEKSIDDIINDIYKLLDKSKNQEEYIYSPTDNYVSDDNLRNDYYIFIVNQNIGGEGFVTLSYNILVNKNNYAVYNYYPDGSMKNIGKLSN